MTLSYAFGGNSGQSYDELQRRRAFAEGLLQRGMSGQPKTAIEGINSAASSIIGALLARKFGAQDAAAKQDYSNSIAGLFGGQSQPAQTSIPYDPNSPANIGSDTMAAIGKPSNAMGVAQIRQGLIDRGLSPQVADGFVMNFRDESGLDPSINENNPTVPGSRGGFGLAQWTGPRRVALEKFAASQGKSVSDPNVQMDFLMTELHGPEAGAAKSFLAAPDAGQAAAAIATNFLRPNKASLDQRVASYTGGQFADQWTGKVMQAMADPRATDAQRNLLGMLLEQRMKQSDPAYQVGLAKDRAELAALNNPQAKVPELVTTRLMLANQAGLQPGTPEWQNFMVTGNTIGRGANEYGLTPQIGRDKDGNPVLLQVGKDGTAVTTKLPDGVTVALDEKAFQSAKGQAAGKAAGGAAVNMQPAEITAKQLNDQIDSVLNDPNLNAMIGPLQGRLPNMSGASQAFQGRLDQIKGSLFLQAYTMLKGGGQITEIEGQKATDAMARLSTAQNETDFRQALNDIRGVIQAGLDRIKSQADYSTSPGQSAPADQSGGTTYTYDPVTGELK